MFKAIFIILAAIVSALCIASAHAEDPSSKGLGVKPGDLIVQRGNDGWAVMKILSVDAWPDGTSVAHCLTYLPMPSKPTVESLKKANVRIWHAPINAGSFSTGWELIGNQAPSKDDLVGFIEYLKLTDFPRYISFTGQDSKEIVRKANEHYKRAYALGDQGRRKEAIAEYSEAIDIFPLFYEAIDNRAFTYMELGKFEEALRDFEQSFRVNPAGVTAFFSKGECLMKLGQLKAAESVFQEGLTRFPEQRAMFQKFLDRVRALQGNG